MKVAVLHITRMKITSAQHEILTDTSQDVITKYVKNAFSKEVEKEKIHGYFINSGHDWKQMREIIEDINAKNYDAFMLWMTPGVTKMPLFSKDIVSFINSTLVKTKLANLHYSGGYMCFLSANMRPTIYGTKTSVPETVNF